MTVDSAAIRDYFLSKLQKSSSETKRIRLMWANRWLSFAGDKPLSEWNETLVQSYRTKLESEVNGDGKPKYKPLTVRLGLEIVGRVFDAANAVHEQEKRNLIQSADPHDPAAMVTVIQAMSSQGADKDFPRGWLPEVQSEERDHPAMPLEDLKTLISAAKAGKLEPVEVAFSALASVYGLRKGELITVLPEHIDYKAGTIWLDTEKHGEKRNQQLVKEIVPYLKAYKFDLEYSPAQLHWMFIKICAKAKIGLVRHQGWHSLRRRALTDVLDSLSGDQNLKRHAEFLAHLFFRWKTTSGGIVERYYTPEEADKIVIEHHPIRLLWK
jgi:integrase